MLARNIGNRPLSIPNLSQLSLEHKKKEAKENIEKDFAGYNLNDPAVIGDIMFHVRLETRKPDTVEELINLLGNKEAVDNLMDTLAFVVLSKLGVVNKRYAGSHFGSGNYYYNYVSPRNGETVNCRTVTYKQAIEDIKIFLQQAI